MSNKTCLSLAPILRCVGLSHTFSATLLIPPALGLFFCVALFFRRSGDKKRFLLAAEGIVYLLIALMDALSEIVPATTFSMSTFKGLDTTIGVLSDVPILLLSVFFFLFVRSVLVPDLHPGLQRIVSFVFLLVIPATLIVNTLASFVGISYAIINSDQSGPQIGVGFKDTHAMDVWNFLQGWALALLGFTQFIVFCLIVVRLARPRAAGNVKTVGLAIIAVGCLIEFVECMVGYAPTSLVVIFVRRSMHSLARAMFCVGVLAGGAIVPIAGSTRNINEKTSIRSRIGSPEPGSFVHVGGEGESILEKPMAPVQIDPELQLARARTVIKKMEEAAFNPFEPGRTPTHTPTRPNMDVPFRVQDDAPMVPKVVVRKDSDPFDDMKAQQPPIEHPYAMAVAVPERSPFASDEDSDGQRTPTEVVPASTPRPRDPKATDRTKERVTVHWDSASGLAPHLEMRLSGIDLPSPSAVLASLRRFDALRPNSDPVPDKPRLPRTNTVAGSLSELRQQYEKEAGKDHMWYPFRGSPIKGPGLARSLTTGHARSTSSLSSHSFSAANDIEAGDASRDPQSSRHSRVRTLDSHLSRGMSMTSGISYMSDASDFVSHLAPRFPDIPPLPQSRVVSTLMPSKFSTYTASEDESERARTPNPIAVSPFIDPSEETEEDAARAIRGPRDLPALDIRPVSANEGLAYEYPSATSTRKMGSLDVPMSAIDSPELVEVPGTARPPAPPMSASTFTSYGESMSTPHPLSPAGSISSFTSTDAGTPMWGASTGIRRPGKPVDLVSVKSIGSAPRKATPVATPATATRGSVPIEHFSFDLAPHVDTPGMAPHTAMIHESPVSEASVQPWMAQ